MRVGDYFAQHRQQAPEHLGRKAGLGVELHGLHGGGVSRGFGRLQELRQALGASGRVVVAGHSACACGLVVG